MNELRNYFQKHLDGYAYHRGNRKLDKVKKVVDKNDLLNRHVRDCVLDNIDFRAVDVLSALQNSLFFGLGSGERLMTGAAVIYIQYINELESFGYTSQRSPSSMLQEFKRQFAQISEFKGY